MADLTNDTMLRYRNPKQLETEMWTLDNSAAQTIYKGQPMVLDVSADTLYARGFIDAMTITTTDRFIGIATEGCVVATTDVEATNEIEIAVAGEVGFRSSVFTDANIGDTVYMSDSSTLSATATANVKIGTVSRVIDGWCYVKLAGVGATNSGA